MKGQYMFLLCIILLFVLIALRVGINYSALFVAEDVLTETYLKEMNKMVVKQSENVFIISYNNKTYIEKNFEDFLKYMQNSYFFEVVSVKVNIPLVKENEETVLNVTIFNGLYKTINNVDITFSYDGSQRFLDKIESGESIKTNFTFSVSSDANFTLNVTYFTQEKIEKIILVPIIIGKESFVYYFREIFPNRQEEEIYGNMFW